MNHSPGPWTYDHRGFVRDKCGDVIAKVFDEEAGLQHRDGRLIAVAPELLFALNFLLSECSFNRQMGEAWQNAAALVRRLEG